MRRTMPPKPGRPRTSRSYRLPDDLLAAFEAHAKEARRPMTTEIEIAMENHLAALGKWPPGATAPPSLPPADPQRKKGPDKKK